MPELKNTKYERFVQEYMIDLNATQAAIRAGYSSNSAQQTSSWIMSKPMVRARVDELLAERSRRTGINQDRVIRELSRIAFVNPPDFIDTDTAMLRKGASADDTAAIASVRVKRKDGDNFTEIEREIKLADKLKALELLGKHLGMFTDNVRLQVEVPKIIDDVGCGDCGA